MRGRKPVPSHLKLITGNPGHRPVEPEVPVVVSRPERPSHLDARACAEWDRIVPELELVGLLTKIDRAALSMYCQAFSRWQLAEERIAALSQDDPAGAGLVVKSKNDYQMLSQWLVISNKAQEQLRAYLGEFGMSPVARARVRGHVGSQLPMFDDDPMDAFLRAGNGTPR